jgi:CheY-like chemotaxis protein
MDGLQAARELKRDRRLRSKLFIAHTATDEPLVRRVAAEIGFRRMVIKGSQALIETIDALLEMPDECRFDQVTGGTSKNPPCGRWRAPRAGNAYLSNPSGTVTSCGKMINRARTMTSAIRKGHTPDGGVHVNPRDAAYYVQHDADRRVISPIALLMMKSTPNRRIDPRLLDDRHEHRREDEHVGTKSSAVPTTSTSIIIASMSTCVLDQRCSMVPSCAGCWRS